MHAVATGEVFVLIEAKPGPNGQEVGNLVFAGSDGRPDLQIQVSRNLGNGSAAVCDKIEGGVPAINPPRFDIDDTMVTEAFLDLACRFQRLSANDPCTLTDASGEHKILHPDTTAQFCMLGSGTATFPAGDTIVTVKVRDKSGELGPQQQIVVRVVTPTPTPRSS